MAVCSSCGRKTSDFVQFECSGCDNSINRCKECKSNEIPFTCVKCGFNGP
ncbi:RNA-binding protein [Candidatus Micrarchaeota archaeon]|nr:RNA-binding protein [Candidatus Micrarchaeota archaeon]